MGFLVITCLGHSKKFLGLLSLRLSMIIMAAFIGICAWYCYFEAQIFFKDTKAFGLVNKEAYSIIEGAIALLLLVDFFIQNYCYTLFLYLLTFALAGATLAYNVFKISIFNDKINQYNITHKLVQFMFLIRIGAEFLIQMTVCYISYSYKKELEKKTKE
jgi:hypothetical protein